jgi:hypothetical protein
MFQQDAAGAGILTEDEVGLLEQTNGAEGHILHIADRCGNEIEQWKKDFKIIP